MSEAVLLFGDSESNANLMYRTRFLAGDPFAYVEGDGGSMLVVNSMEKGRAQKESIVDDVRSFEEFRYSELVGETGDRRAAMAGVLQRALNAVGAQSASVEARFPVLYADLLRRRGVQLTVDPDLLVDHRRHKDAWEIEAIEEAQRATENVMSHAINIIAKSEPMNDVLVYEGIPLTSERLRAEIELFLMRAGMDPSQTPIVAGGPGAADPHFLGEGPLRPGEAIVLDVFPRSKRTRYYADMTRTVVKGEPGETLRRMYKATSVALDRALAAIGPGVSGKEVHQRAIDALAEAGYGTDGSGPRMIHGTGHGVGLDIHEGPSLGTYGDELRPGDAITVEPGLYDPQIGAIRLEDLVIVTEKGCRNLTNFPRQFEV